MFLAIFLSLESKTKAHTIIQVIPQYIDVFSNKQTIEFSTTNTDLKKQEIKKTTKKDIKIGNNTCFI